MQVKNGNVSKNSSTIVDSQQNAVIPQPTSARSEYVSSAASLAARAYATPQIRFIK